MNALDLLRQKYPWPTERPNVPPSERGWDGGGRHLVTTALTARPVGVILEIGSFLGLSTRTWLQAAPGATVVCVDPWPDTDVIGWGIHDWPELAGQHFFDVFLSSCWSYRDRIIPVRGISPEVLRDIHAVGVRPDLVFIDGDHTYEAVVRELDICTRLFPGAKLTGDDWHWTKRYCPPASVREAVTGFALAYGLTIEAEGNTWVLH